MRRPSPAKEREAERTMRQKEEGFSSGQAAWLVAANQAAASIRTVTRREAAEGRERQVRAGASADETCDEYAQSRDVGLTT